MNMSQLPEKLHIVLLSIHGLIRGHDLELGRDADTGGQTKYVVELARSLGASAKEFRKGIEEGSAEDSPADSPETPRST